MIEKTLNIWSVVNLPGISWIGITTNGFVKNDGTLVMGRGTASQAKERYLGLEYELGKLVRSGGNICHFLNKRKLFTFPVKHRWMEDADLDLIARSSIQLGHIASASPRETFYLPRPGCGNGRLTWDVVKPYLEHLPNNVVCVSLR
jgi:hypothetical protein